MELRLLEYFLAAAREGSISAAAASLHVSQPALSVQLKHLENELGKPLMIRGTKGSRKLQLTEEGKIVQKRAEEIMLLVDRTAKEVRSCDEQISGDICIAAGETDNMRLIARITRRLQEKHPDIRIHLSSGNAQHVLDCLERGVADFGLVFGEVDLHKYEGLALPVEDSWGVLMRKDSPLANLEFITPADLIQSRLIVSRQEGDDLKLARWMNCDVDKLPICATYNLVFNAILLVDEGVGNAVCFRYLVNTEGRTSLCFRPMRPPLKEGGMIIWKKYQTFPRAVQAFLDCLRCCLQENCCCR